MEYNFDKERPIYLQLVEKIKIDIISGRIKIGEKIKSVRELSLEAKVNPNTMQKALTELENQGLIYTKRTKGKYVTEKKELIENIRKDLANKNANKFITDMNNIGISSKEAIVFLKKIGGKSLDGIIGMQKLK